MMKVKLLEQWLAHNKHSQMSGSVIIEKLSIHAIFKSTFPIIRVGLQLHPRK